MAAGTVSVVQVACGMGCWTPWSIVEGIVWAGWHICEFDEIMCIRKKGVSDCWRLGSVNNLIACLLLSIEPTKISRMRVRHKREG